MLVQLNYPVPYSVEGYFLNELAGKLSRNKSRIDSHQSPIFFAGLISVNICCFSGYVNFGALAILFKVGASSCLILCDFIPQSLVLIDGEGCSGGWVGTIGQTASHQEQADQRENHQKYSIIPQILNTMVYIRHIQSRINYQSKKDNYIKFLYQVNRVELLQLDYTRFQVG